MLSVLDRNAAEGIRFHLLHDGSLEREDVFALETLVDGRGELGTSAVRDPRVQGLPPAPGGGRVTWFRILIPELVEVNRVLLLDADTLVVDSLVSLWTTDLGEAPIAAVANVVEPARHKHVRSFGLDPRRYLNAGVLLMDLERMRSEDASSMLVRFAYDNIDRISWLDQDALNALFAGRWHALHPRWNTMNSFWNWRPWAVDTFGGRSVDEATLSPGILHFEGPSVCKPWHYVSAHPWRALYRQTLERTPWASTPLVDRTPLTRLLGLLPARWRIDAYVKIRGAQALR